MEGLMKFQNSLFEPILVPGSTFLNTAKVANPKGCFIENEDKKHPVLVMQGKVDETKVQIPREERFLSSLGIRNHLLILQLCLPSQDHFSLELIITHVGNSRMKLIIGTYLKEARCEKMIGRVPVATLPLVIPRNEWVHVVFHIKGTVEKIFNLPRFNFIDSVSFCGNAKIGMMMSTSNEQLCLERRQTKMAMVLVPAYSPSVWSNAGSAPDDNAPRGEPCLSDLKYEKSNRKDMLNEIIPNTNHRGSTDSKKSTSRTLSPLRDSSRLRLASPVNPNTALTPSDSHSSSESRRLPAIKATNTCPKTSKYFRLVDTADRASCLQNKQNYPTLLRRAPHAVPPKDAPDLCAGKAALPGGKQSGETGIENPVTSWMGDIPLYDRDTTTRLLRASGKKDLYMPKLHVVKERGACNLGNPLQTNTSLVRKRRPLQGNDRGGDVEPSFLNTKKKQRAKSQMRFVSQNRVKAPKGPPKQKLASEISICSISSSAEFPQVDDATSSFFGEPKVGYGVGYLGVLNEEGEYIDHDANIHLKRALAFKYSTVDE